MKTPEDEAFDDLARNQGAWGGGYQAKRKAAADKLQEPWNEDEWRRNNWRCSHGWLRGEQCDICNAAQEPVACVQDLDEVKRKHLVYEKGMDWKDPLYTTPPQREWVGLTKEDMPNGLDPMFDHEYFIAGMVFASKVLEKKNT